VLRERKLGLIALGIDHRPPPARPDPTEVRYAVAVPTHGAPPRDHNGPRRTSDTTDRAGCQAAFRTASPPWDGCEQRRSAEDDVPHILEAMASRGINGQASAPVFQRERPSRISSDGF
jgi:hypothetical protein